MSNNLKDKLPGLRENVSLAEYTTFKIGGPAKYFLVVKTSAELIKVLEIIIAEKINYRILGGGSNLLINDEGFDGIIIKNEIIDFEIEGNRMIAGAGLNLGFLVQQCVDRGLSGAEYLVGIPGTVGGAICGNAGAWGHNIGELVDKVIIFDGKKVRELSKADCKFSYRSSVIKKEGYAIISAELVLAKGVREEVLKTTTDFLRQRSSGRQPKGMSAGCTFKNIDLLKIKPEKIKKALDLSDEDYDDLVKFGKLPIGYVLDHLGLKGKKIGGAMVALEHCNFIVNGGGASANDVIELISYIKQKVRDELGVQLEEEVQYLGF